MSDIPLAVKLTYSVWLAAWVPLHAGAYGLSSFLWLCCISNLVMGVALWRESAALVSWQAVSVLVVEVVYSLDVGVRWLSGRHLVGGTEYVFDSTQPLLVRTLSLFHLAMPVLILWSVARLGYDRRAFRWQVAAAWIILPVSLLFGRSQNLNGVWAPVNGRPLGVPWSVYFVVLLFAYPLLVSLPTHAALSRCFGAPLTPPSARRPRGA